MHQEKCTHCNGHVITDYSSGDYVCTSCGLVQIGSVQISEYSNFNFQSSEYCNLKCLTEQMVFSLGFEESFFESVWMHVLNFKQTNNLQKVKNPKYVICAAILDCSSQKHFAQFAFHFSLDQNLLSTFIHDNLTSSVSPKHSEILSSLQHLSKIFNHFVLEFPQSIVDLSFGPHIIAASFFAIKSNISIATVAQHVQASKTSIYNCRKIISQTLPSPIL